MADLTLQTLIEFRGEMREFRDETRQALTQHDHRLNVLTAEAREFRDEMHGFRDETRRSLAQHDRGLNLLTEQMRDESARLAQLETHMAALLATMPHVHTRIDDLAARLATVEARLAALP